MKHHKTHNTIFLLFVCMLFFSSLQAQVIVGWDTSPLTGYGPNPFSPTSSDGITSDGLTRGSGVLTPGAGLNRGWGGRGWKYPNAASSIAANAFTTFTFNVNSGYEVSLSSINPWKYRRNASGPPLGLVQYKVNDGTFNDIITVSFSAGAAGGNVPSINLSGIPQLQNLAPGTNVTFRIVPYGASGVNGFWFVYDKVGSAEIDFAVTGSVCYVNTFYADVDGDMYGNDFVTIEACEIPPTGYWYSGGDCNDNDYMVNPGSYDDVCNGIDRNCDGIVDLAPHVLLYADADGDGYGNDLDYNYFSVCYLPPGYVENGGDCDDTNPSVNPGAGEVCDGSDNDCNGSIDDGISCDPDNDGDGYPQSVDCDDYNPSINPGAPEVCNGIDDNCDGEPDDGLTALFYADIDGDMYGDDFNTIFACELPFGYWYSGGDCNDNDYLINPGSYDDVCNGIDRNCDGMVDLAPHVLLYADADGDGYGNDFDYNYFSVCFLPPGYVENGGDCDDNNSSVYPGGEEVCDGLDNDCNGSIDDGVSCDPDNDGDGYPQSVDCDDYNSSINPGATEECNEIDDNCNGEIDEGVTVYAYYTDYDGDYFGPDDGLFYSCYIINDLTTVGGDCDDYNYSVNPSVAEVCYNGIDDNCDGSIDEYCDPDNDGDGYPQSMDCDDNNFEINPGAYDDVCNGIDRNCDGMVDLAPHILLYADADADGYGNDYDYNYFSVCALPTGYVEYGGDCDDDNSSVYPGAEEVCNGIDDNCDGTIDDNCRLIGQQQSISIFPNPASHQFTINAAVTGTLQGQAYIYIYNALGEEILVVQTEIQNGKIQKTILFDEGNASGIYLVKITAGGAAELHTQLVLE